LLLELTLNQQPIKFLFCGLPVLQITAVDESFTFSDAISSNLNVVLMMLFCQRSSPSDLLLVLMVK
jgi:hypothetical protein